MVRRALSALLSSDEFSTLSSEPSWLSCAPSSDGSTVYDLALAASELSAVFDDFATKDVAADPSVAVVAEASDAALWHWRREALEQYH